MARKWKTINSKVKYNNPWIKIHEDDVIRPDGNKGIYGYLEKPSGNFIIPLDNENNVYLINEYRYPIKKSVIQTPAGVIESDDIIQQAKTELFEETGITAKKWENLGGFYVAPGHETTFVNAFLATDLDLSKLKTDNQESNELILEIVKINLSDLKEKILNGMIECGISLAALNLFFLKYPDKLNK